MCKVLNATFDKPPILLKSLSDVQTLSHKKLGSLLSSDLQKYLQDILKVHHDTSQTSASHRLKRCLILECIPLKWDASGTQVESLANDLLCHDAASQEVNMMLGGPLRRESSLPYLCGVLLFRFSFPFCAESAFD